MNSPALWSIVGSPWTGIYRDASVIHDVYCDNQREPWKAVHRVFYDAMLAKGVGKTKAKLMYAAVYRFGPRWDVVYSAKACADCAATKYQVDRFSPIVNESEMKALKEMIEADDPPLEKIENEADSALSSELIIRQLGTPLLIQ